MQPTRRSLLKGAVSSAALVAMSGAVPQFLLDASVRAAESRGETILVVVQLTGGNDGLNTLIPYANDIYHRERPSLALGKAQVRRIDDSVGLHPSMEGFSKLLEAGKLGIVQGVGYPNPNRSHFSSMDIWHTALRAAATNAESGFSSNASHRATGWLGRYLDALAATQGKAAGDLPALHLGASPGRLPLALIGEQIHVTSMQDAQTFKLEDGNDSRFREAVEQAIAATRTGGEDDLITFLGEGARVALRSSKQVQESLARYQTDEKYPQTSLSRRLKTVAQLIDAGLKTRIYYLDLDGFDTHANQAGGHASLLAELSNGINAFIRDLDKHGHAQRVLLMTFSEFGRRLHENASQGTDHGAAAPMFLAGGKVRQGLIGAYPSLADLDEGDLKFTTDFRSVYSGILENWLGVPSQPVLGQAFAPLNVTAQALSSQS